MNFIEELEWRGLIQDVTPDLKEATEKGMVTGYVGFDPTASSLHIGNLIPITLLVHLQRCGHRPIMLVGGATGRIGDPSGKDKERQLHSLETIQNNVNCCREQMGKFLNFESGDNKAIMVDNWDFYKEMNALEFLRDVGKNITVGYMMAKESVKKRISTGISFTEFSYQLIQGYDFKCLAEEQNCNLQMGGSDQWGNIMTGVEMVRKILGKKAHALTTPLLTKPDGSKYGKSEGGNIWLDPNLTSPYQFYQFFVNSADDMLEKLLKTFSLKNKEEIEAILEEHNQDRSKYFGQKALAKELTTRVHSDEDARVAIEASEFLFNRKLNKKTLANAPEKVLAALATGMTCFTINAGDLSSGANLVDFISGNVVESVKLVDTKGDARRAIKGNAISVNKDKVKDPFTMLQSSDLIYDKYLFIDNGKKNKFLIIVE